MSEKSEPQFRFMSFGPIKAEHVRCQSCFKPFDTESDLRNHVATFQVSVRAVDSTTTILLPVIARR